LCTMHWEAFWGYESRTISWKSWDSGSDGVFCGILYKDKAGGMCVRWEAVIIEEILRSAKYLI
jgi:hypothetical protein